MYEAFIAMSTLVALLAVYVLYFLFAEAIGDRDLESIVVYLGIIACGIISFAVASYLGASDNLRFGLLIGVPGLPFFTAAHSIFYKQGEYDHDLKALAATLFAFAYGIVLSQHFG